MSSEFSDILQSMVRGPYISLKPLSYLFTVIFNDCRTPYINIAERKQTNNQTKFKDSQ